MLEKPNKSENSTLERKKGLRPMLRKTVIRMGIVITQLSVGTLGGSLGTKGIDYLKFKNERESFNEEIEKLNQKDNYEKILYYYGTQFRDELTGSDDRKLKSNVSPHIESIPTFTGENNKMDSSFIAKIFNETFPKSWVEGEVSAIKYNSLDKPISYASLESNNAKTWADFNRNNKEITFYKPAETSSTYENINKCLTHELGHANDWCSDNETSLKDRMELLLAITDRLNSPDRYESSYVENIGISEKSMLEKYVAFSHNEKYSPEQEQRYNKATEYWAEICSVYFSSPTMLNYEDFKLVDDWVKKNDPNFNNEQAKNKRFDMIITLAP